MGHSILLIPAVIFRTFQYLYLFEWHAHQDRDSEVTSKAKSQWLKESNPPLAHAFCPQQKTVAEN